MLENDLYKKCLHKVPRIRYADIRTLKRRHLSVALRNNLVDVSDHEDKIVGCRALDSGYGVSSTNKTDAANAEAALEQAVELARGTRASITLRQVTPEVGSYEHPVKNKPTVGDAKNLIMFVRDSINDKLDSVKRIEIVFSYTELDAGLVTSEGTDVKESSSTTDLEISLTIRTPSGMSDIKKVTGGKGGMEAIQHRDFDRIVGDLVIVARSFAGAKRFSPLESGKKFRVILDSEAAGALARLISCMLTADGFSSKLFDTLTIPKELEIVDNPSIPGAYGSFVWDDEGVRGRKKVLVSDGSVDLLHTRLTAGEYDVPGNAHGISQVPKPSMSNVYISTSDWHFDEMLNDTKQGIFMKGARRAEVNTSSGIIELEPIISYIIEQKEIKQAISNVKMIDTVKNILQNIDAIGKLISLIPNTERGFNASTGAPYIRIDGARCAYGVMQ
ncbi:MAG: TldD/PmbA family protein [Nitrososphaerales archaeon]